MKIIKGADRARVEWAARKLVELVGDGTVNFNIDIQRGYVWKDNDKKSALIRSLYWIDMFLLCISIKWKIFMKEKMENKGH